MARIPPKPAARVPCRRRLLGGAAFAALAVAAAACSDSTGPRVPAGIVAAGGDEQQGIVATPLDRPLSVRVTDHWRRPVSGVAVRWRAEQGEIAPDAAETGPDGRATAVWTLGPGAGPQSATAEIEGHALSVAFSATALADGAAELAIQPMFVYLDPGDSTRLEVEAFDRFGNPVPTGAPEWASSDPEVVEVSGDGLARGVAEGMAVLTARLDAAESSVEVRVGGDGPVILAIAPDTLRPGETVVITGRDFSATAGVSAVYVDGVLASVLEAAPTSLTVRLPDAYAFACRPARAVAVTVRVGDREGKAGHPLVVASRHRLEPGESMRILDFAGIGCKQLDDPDGSYVVSVFSSGSTLVRNTAFRLVGADGSAPAEPFAGRDQRVGSATAAPSGRGAVTTTATAAPPRRGGAAGRGGDALAGLDRGHARALDESRRLVDRLGAPGRPARPRRPDHAGAVQPAQAAQAPVVASTHAFDSVQAGDTVTLRIPEDFRCDRHHQIRARAVHAGSRALVLEDVRAPRAGSVDEAFRRMGQEFDDAMWPIIAGHFGNPLAHHGGQRVLMLFSEHVNSMELGGFVWGGDFYDPVRCASSNFAPIFYMIVPSDTAEVTVSAAAWERWAPSTIIHETKHIASFAERFARAGGGIPRLEESWLEEATARIAEELWARSVYGYTQRGNHTYQDGLVCEVAVARELSAGCPTNPQIMFKHFNALYEYYQELEALSTLGSARANDWTFYASAWLLVRWALDHTAASEAAFLQDLTQTALRGRENLETRAGTTFAEMLADWSLALAVDAMPDFTPERDRLTHPSWDTRSVFEGMNEDRPNTFPLPFPLAIRELPPDFAADVDGIRDGTAALFRIGGARSGPQMLELLGPDGGPPADHLRMAIVRVD